MDKQEFLGMPTAYTDVDAYRAAVDAAMAPYGVTYSELLTDVAPTMDRDERALLMAMNASMAPHRFAGYFCDLYRLRKVAELPDRSPVSNRYRAAVVEFGNCVEGWRVGTDNHAYRFNEETGQMLRLGLGFYMPEVGVWRFAASVSTAPFICMPPTNRRDVFQRVDVVPAEYVEVANGMDIGDTVARAIRRLGWPAEMKAPVQALNEESGSTPSP